MGNNTIVYSTNLMQDATIAVSSEGGAKERLVDYDNYSTWSSNGSNDSTTEVIEFTLAGTANITDIFIINTNGLAGKVETYTGSYATYDSVFSGNTNNSLHFSGDVSSVSRVRISLDTTQTPSTEKSIGQVLVLTKFFEFERNPDDWDIEDQAVVIKTYNSLRKVNVIRLFEEVRKVSLGFNHFLAGDDFDYVNDLQRSRISFMLNMCGETQRGLKGWDWIDIKRYVITNNIKAKISSQVLQSGIKQALVLEESVK